MNRVLWRMPVLIALLLAPVQAGAAARFSETGGHLSVGYARLVTAEAPGGSVSMAAGLDYPLARTLRVGLDLGYDLLGSRTVQRGSLFASVDYSALQATAFLHWLPPRGPVRRVSLGPALVNRHGDLSVTGGGASFSDLAVHETAGAVAAQITLMQAKPAPVRLGLELGGSTTPRRLGVFPWVTGEWTRLGARVTVHY
jgi:hypothetical protein